MVFIARGLNCRLHLATKMVVNLLGTVYKC